MCTVVFLRRPDHRWPLILGANRDEMADRPWRLPGRHWPDRDDVTAGMDELAGGSWLGINDTGIVAGILNRKDSLGPDPNLRSRGELVLEALDHADAIDAAKALSDLDSGAYRSFNLFIADSRDAYWLRSRGGSDSQIELFEIPEGISMLTAWDLNAAESGRTRHYLPIFEAAPAPDPDEADWRAWEALLAGRDFENGTDASEAMLVETDRGFGTLSSSLIALGAPTEGKAPRIWRFSDNPGQSGSYKNTPF